MKHPRAAMALLLIGGLLSYCWYWVPAQYGGFAWNISTSALVILLLLLVGMLLDSVEVWAVVTLLAVFKATVIGCDVWYMVDPWPVRPGQALCSAYLNMPLGVIGLSVGTMLGLIIYRGRK